MGKKILSVMTFMSWENEEWNGNRNLGTIRAIALCDQQGFFNQAINCMRDGDMGEKDENGVYGRIWYGDYIENGDCKNLRPATQEEVELYLKYVTIESAVGSDDPYEWNVKIVKEDAGHYTKDCYVRQVLVEFKQRPLWEKLLYKLDKKSLPL